MNLIIGNKTEKLPIIKSERAFARYQINEQMLENSLLTEPLS